MNTAKTLLILTLLAGVAGFTATPSFARGADNAAGAADNHGGRTGDDHPGAGSGKGADAGSSAQVARAGDDNNKNRGAAGNRGGRGADAGSSFTVARNGAGNTPATDDNPGARNRRGRG